MKPIEMACKIYTNLLLIGNLSRKYDVLKRHELKEVGY